MKIAVPILRSDGIGQIVVDPVEDAGGFLVPPQFMNELLGLTHYEEVRKDNWRSRLLYWLSCHAEDFAAWLNVRAWESLTVRVEMVPPKVVPNPEFGRWLRGVVEKARKP